jgi:hypothetical protein
VLLLLLLLLLLAEVRVPVQHGCVERVPAQGRGHTPHCSD